MPDVALLPLLLGGTDHVYGRLRDRLDGLTDAEYLWEPVPNMWSVREQAAGWVVFDDPEAPAPVPLTTIAWRTWHIASSCLASYVSPHLGAWPLGVEGLHWHPDPGDARAALDTSYSVFRERIDALGEDGVRQPLGPAWGPYAEDSWAALVVHAMDEMAHHGAEIALLRDLYPRRHEIVESSSPQVGEILRDRRDD